ncbi:MAG: DUF2868 domain-containing protein [Opitutales bacterium]
MPPEPSSVPWSLARLIDLEYALFRIERGAIERVPSGWSTGETSRRGRLSGWLSAQQAEHRDLVWPGRPAEDLLDRVGLLALGFSAVSGALLALGLIAYEGDSPANITLVWAGLVGLQLVWLLALFLVQALRRRGRQDAPGRTGSFAFETLGGIWRWLLLRRVRQEGGSVENDDFAAFWSWFRRRWSLHRRTLARAVLARLHAAGVAFNAGVLLALVIALAVTDRAFGWESTLIREADTMHRLVQAVSLPWRDWLPAAAPDLSTVQGSRFVVQQGIDALDTQALSAWWPFILMSVLVYGLLPRLVLAVVTGWRARRLARCPTLDNTDCLRLDAALATPVNLFRGEAAATGPSRIPSGPADQRERRSGLGNYFDGPVTVRVDPDWLDEQDAEALHRTLTASLDVAGLEIEAAAASAGPEGPAVVRLMEAWQPPVREHLEALGRWQASVSGPCLLILTGRPDPGRSALPGLTPPDPADLAVWRDRVADAGLSRIIVEPWAPAATASTA